MGSRPNIILILIDDIGTDQLSMYDVQNGGIHNFSTNSQHTYAITPTLNRLAREGLRFNWAFTSPTCSPTRAQLLTGRYPFRTGIGGIVNARGLDRSLNPPTQQQLDLPLSEQTLPELLENAGYSTAIFGKWHLAREESLGSGVPSAFNPCDPNDPLCPGPFAFKNGAPNVPGRAHPILSGWSHFAGIMGNPSNLPSPFNSILPPVYCQSAVCPTRGYYSWIRVESVASPLPVRDDAIWNANVVTTDTPPGTDTFITTVQRQDLVEWVTSAPQPFFAMWSTTAPHSPYQGSPDTLISDYVGCDSGGNVIQGLPSSTLGAPLTNDWDRYQYLIQSLDTEIGNMCADLGPEILDSTTIIVMGDNGTPIGVAEEGEGAILCGGSSVNRISPTSTNKGGPQGNERFKGSPFLTGTSIPLIFWGCGVGGAGCREPAPVSGLVDDQAVVETVDVFRTILDLGGASPPTGVVLDGDSMLDLLECQPSADHSSACSLIYAPNGSFSCAQTFDAGLTARIDPAGPTISPQGPEIYRLVWRTLRQNDPNYDICSVPPGFERLYRVYPDAPMSAAGSGILEQVDVSATQPAVLNLLRAELQSILFQPGAAPCFVACNSMIPCSGTCPSDPFP